MKLHDELGNEYVFSIFLIVLGNSRYKYIELTFDQTQQTLFKCMINAFHYFGGSTKEILFDNMKTIVDQVKSDFNDVVINNKALQFSKDAGFKIVTCRPYRPRTKGKVETLAKIMNRLKAYDYEFDTIDKRNADPFYLSEESKTALKVRLMSNPLWEKKRSSSIATKASFIYWGTLEYSTQKRFSVPEIFSYSTTSPFWST